MDVLWNFLAEDWKGFLVNLYLAIALVPTLRDTQKPPLLTSVPTGICLIVLGLGGSYRALAPSIVAVCGGCVWLSIAFQRYRQGRTNGAQ